MHMTTSKNLRSKLFHLRSPTSTRLCSPRSGKTLDSVLEDKARRDTHREQLLEEELCGVWDHELDDGLASLAACGRECRVSDDQIPELRNAAGLTHAPAVVTHEPARSADVDLERVRRDHQTLQEELRGAVGDQAIALHLAETKTTVARTTLGGLPGQDCARTARTGVHLVQHLVIGHTVSASAGARRK